MKKNILQYVFVLLLASTMVLGVGVENISETEFNGASPGLQVTFLNQDPDPASPDEILELRWKVVKTGNENIENVLFKIDELEYPLALLDENDREKSLGAWRGWSDADEYATLLYRFRVDDSTPSGTADVRLSYTLDEGHTWFRLDDYIIAIDDKEDAQLITSNVRTSPQRLTADTDNAELTIEIANIGDEDAENVQVQLLLPEGFSASYGYSDRDTIGTIAAGESEEAVFYVDVAENIVGTEYETELLVKFKEEGDDNNEYLEMSIPTIIPLTATPLFQIMQVVSSPEVLGPGDTAEVRITVKNIGNDKAESTSLRAFKDSTQPFEFTQKSDFIGQLAPGEEGTALLEFVIDEQALAKEYRLDVELRTIHDDNVLLFQDVVSVHVDAEKSEVKGPLTGMQYTFRSTIFLLLGLIIVAGFAFWHGRKHGSKK